MFNKLNIKTLAIVFGALIIILALAQWLRKSGNERNFRDYLVEVDTAKITSITIIPKGKKDPLVLQKTASAWELVYKNKHYRTEKSAVESLLQGLTGLKTERLVATGEENFEQYEVTPPAGTSIRVEEKGKTKAEFIIGKTSYQQGYQNISATTFARLKDENEVYALSGFLPMNFAQDLNTLRFRKIGDGSVDKIQRVAFTYEADSSFTLSQSNHEWNVNGQSVDSTNVYNLLQTITSATGNEFADDNIPLNKPYGSVLAEADGKNVIEIKAYATDSANRFYVTSSVNPGAIFIEDKNGLVGRIFMSEKQLKK